MTGERLGRRFAVAAASVALMVATGAAKADVVTFSGWNTSIPAGESLITNFSSGAGLSGSFSLETGSTGDYAAPAIASGNVRDPNQYLAIEGGDSATLSLGGSYHDVSIYVGSLEYYNGFAFSNGDTYTGSSLAGIDGAADSGDQQASNSNGLFTFEFATAVSSVTFASTYNALEVASVTAGVPETSTWAMMILGFAGLAFAGYWQQRAAKLV